MNTDRITNTLVELCEIPSPSRCERPVADYILSRINSLGLDTVEDNAGDDLNGDTGNIIVRVDGKSSSSLLLTAHMDTVMPVGGLPDRINVNITDGVVHTDQNSILGADDKAGIAIALEVLHHRVETSNDMHQLEIVFTVQEEIGARGAAYLDKDAISAEQGFVLDGDTPVGTVIVSAPHKLRYDLVVRGVAAHAALEPEKGI
ncbi:MAG: M20/M25/M40 family metallo-hydrolase, partial [Chloroflexota bacterium]|nr:M20/M25/M40 family metallo-hydrolase [Chloroflexota bacterium]